MNTGSGVLTNGTKRVVQLSFNLLGDSGMGKSKADVARVEREREGALSSLRKLLRRGQVVYTVNTRVLRSGMGAWIKVLVGKGREVIDISGLVADATGSKWDDGVFFSGCGLDRGYFLVSRLSSRLWPKDGNKPGRGLRQAWL